MQPEKHSPQVPAAIFFEGFHAEGLDMRKTCVGCNLEKELADFSARTGSLDGLRKDCKACRAAYSRQWYIDNKEKIRIDKLEYRSENKESIAERQRVSRSRNKSVIINRNRNRRAKSKMAEGSHSASDITSMLERQKHKCANCRCCLKESGYHVDHIQPLSRGGSNWPSNLQCLCPTCNLKKHAKDPLDWAQENGRLI